MAEVRSIGPCQISVGDRPITPVASMSAASVPDAPRLFDDPMDVDAVASEAIKLFPNKGLHKAAVAFATVHPRALDYLKQAPVLCLMAGVAGSAAKLSAYYGLRIGGPCLLGIGLKDMMGLFKVPYPLRKLAPYALSPTAVPAVSQLMKLDTAVLGRVIPDKLAKQRRWMARLGDWCEHFRWCLKYRNEVGSLRFGWLAEKVPWTASARDVIVVADYAFLSGLPFNDKWGWKRALEEADKWHRAMQAEKILKELGIAGDEVIDDGVHPSNAVSGGYEFLALRTPFEIISEGAAMHHCVASYCRMVMGGGCHIVSIRKDGARVATMELTATYGVRQVQGPCNSDVPEVGGAVSAYVRAVRDVPAVIDGAKRARRRKAVL